MQKLDETNVKKKKENLIWRARVPKILARSYLVINFEVLRTRSTGSSSSFPSASTGSPGTSSVLVSNSSSAPSYTSFTVSL